MKKKICVMLMTMVMAVSSMAGCGSSGSTSGNGEKSSSGDDIVIGTLLPRSGSMAVFGQAAWDGYEIARQMINEKGGIDGKQIVFADADAPDASAAATEAERLISKEKVTAILGSISSANALAATAVAERNATIYWECTAITDEVTESGYNYVFRTVDKSTYRGYAAMDAINDEICDQIGIAKEDVTIAIAAEDSAYGQVQAEAARKKAKELGLNVVAVESYSASATDLSSMVTKLKKADADVLFTVGYINDCKLLWTQAQQYGLKYKAIIGGGSGYTDASFYENFGEFTNGVLDIDTPTGVDDSLFKDEEIKEACEEFRTRYMEMNKTDTVHYCAEMSFNGAWVFFNYVLKNADSMSSDDIVNAAMELSLDESILGTGVKFDETHQNERAESGIYQWKDGTANLVLPKDYAKEEIANLPLANNY